MKLRFLGKETSKGDSPTLYATDDGSYIVQGWKVEDRDLLNRLTDPNVAPSGDLFVEVWTTLFNHLAADGLTGTVGTTTYPVVHTTSPKTCIIAGAPVADAEVRDQMRIPDHEDCVEVSKATMKNLLQEHPVGSDHP